MLYAHVNVTLVLVITHFDSISNSVIVMGDSHDHHQHHDPFWHN